MKAEIGGQASPSATATPATCESAEAYYRLTRALFFQAAELIAPLEEFVDDPAVFFDQTWRGALRTPLDRILTVLDTWDIPEASPELTDIEASARKMKREFKLASELFIDAEAPDELSVLATHLTDAAVLVGEVHREAADVLVRLCGAVYTTPTPTATPTPAPTPTATPTPAPTATPLPTEADLEQRALDQGYDLRRLTDLRDLGFTSPSESARFSLAGDLPLSINAITNAPVIRFEREYERDTDVYVNRLRDPSFEEVAILFDLYESEAEAAALVQAFEFAPEGCWPFLFLDISGYGLGAYMGGAFFEDVEKLEVPIEGVSGFNKQDFLHIYFLSHGRTAGYLLVFGENLGVEDTIPLAAKLTGPPTPTDDAQEPERNLQSLCSIWEMLGNL